MVLQVYNIRKVSFVPWSLFLLSQLTVFVIILIMITSWKLSFVELNNQDINVTSVYEDEILRNIGSENSMYYTEIYNEQLPSYTISDTTLAEYYRLYLDEYCSGEYINGSWTQIECFTWTTEDGVDEIYGTRNLNTTINDVDDGFTLHYFNDKSGTARVALHKLFYSMLAFIPFSIIICCLYWFCFTGTETRSHWAWRSLISLFCLAPVIESILAVVFTRNMYTDLKHAINDKKSLSGVKADYFYTLLSMCILILSLTVFAFLISSFVLFFLKPISPMVEVVDLNYSGEKEFDTQSTSASESSNSVPTRGTFPNTPPQYTPHEYPPAPLSYTPPTEFHPSLLFPASQYHQNYYTSTSQPTYIDGSQVHNPYCAFHDTQYRDQNPYTGISSLLDILNLGNQLLSMFS